MTPEIEAKVHVWIRTNAVDEGQLLGILSDEHGDEIDLNALRKLIKDGFAEYEMERRSWPDTTDCDRLDHAFSSLHSQGLVVMQNAGFTQRDGYDDFLAVLEETPNRDAIRGYCFYSGQDMFDAIQGQGLRLAFGPTDPKEEQTEGVTIGNLVKSELEKAGLTVEWEGTFDKRLSIPSFHWQRR